MKIEFDPDKNKRNIDMRGLPFSIVERFDFSSSLEDIDDRHISEIRIIAIGRIRFHIYTLVYTMRGENIRVISLRKSNKKERIAWSRNLILIS
jgi:uncharacterized protein